MCEQPFRCGDRIRCGVSTIARHFGTSGTGPELLGRAGTVAGVGRCAPLGRDGEWEIRVRYDHLSDGTMGGDATIRHRPEELVPLRDWT